MFLFCLFSSCMLLHADHYETLVNVVPVNQDTSTHEYEVNLKVFNVSDEESTLIANPVIICLDDTPATVVIKNNDRTKDMTIEYSINHPSTNNFSENTQSILTITEDGNIVYAAVLAIFHPNL
jgi:hypothetical protein